MEKAEFIKICTFNVKNIESNRAYVQEPLKRCDIIALQEHWLFNFQLQDMERIFCTHSVHSKTVDDDNLFLRPKTQKPRGYGGVAILFSKKLNVTVSYQSEETGLSLLKC